jgi:hypothetical protein
LTKNLDQERFISRWIYRYTQSEPYKFSSLIQISASPVSGPLARTCILLAQLVAVACRSCSPAGISARINCSFRITPNGFNYKLF